MHGRLRLTAVVFAIFGGRLKIKCWRRNDAQAGDL